LITETLDAITCYTPKWMRWAACANSDPALFHPEPGEKNTDRIKTAQQICHGCPVRIQCLVWAYETEDHFAILGGKTGNQRKRIENRIAKLMQDGDFLLDAWLLLATA
jgi:WhiB family redox-sensing transcriptional regulator